MCLWMLLMFSFRVLWIMDNGLFLKCLIDVRDDNEIKKSVCALITSTLGLLPHQEADRPPVLLLLIYKVYYDYMALTSKTNCFCILMGEGKGWPVPHKAGKSVVTLSLRDRLRNFVKPRWLKFLRQNTDEERTTHKMRDAQKGHFGAMLRALWASDDTNKCMHLRKLFEAKEETTRKRRQNNPENSHKTGRVCVILDSMEKLCNAQGIRVLRKLLGCGAKLILD